MIGIGMIGAGLLSNRAVVLGTAFDNISAIGAAKKAIMFLESTRGDKACVIITPNPEIVMAAKRDKRLAGIISSADLVVPDGIGVVLASKLNKRNDRIRERVAGFDLILSLFEYMKDSGKTAYFLGGKPGVAKKAAKAAQEAYKGLSVVGCADGYFDEQREKIIEDEIRAASPDLLLVCMGCPKQEYWIAKHMRGLNVKLMIGAGGTLDVLAGEMKRAPAFLRKLNLEWLYRIVTDPTRLKRAYVLPLFVLEVFYGKINRSQAKQKG